MWIHATPGSGISIEDYAVVIDPSDPTILYLANNYSGGLVYKCSDRGGSLIGTCLSGFFTYALAIDPSNSNIIYAGTGGGAIFKTTNGGVAVTSIQG
jgi:hypothetical protein